MNQIGKLVDSGLDADSQKEKTQCILKILSSAIVDLQ